MGALRKTRVRRRESHAEGSIPGQDPPLVDLFADLDDLRGDACAGALEHLEGRGHDLGTDPVAVGHRDGGVVGHAISESDGL